MKNNVIILLAIFFFLASCEEKNGEKNMSSDVAARLVGQYNSTSPFFATVDSLGTSVSKSDPNGYMVVNSVNGLEANVSIFTNFDFPEKQYNVQFSRSRDFNNSSSGDSGFKYEYSNIEGGRSVNITFGVYGTDSTHLAIIYDGGGNSFVKTCWKY